jgi:hypothetical protein
MKEDGGLSGLTNVVWIGFAVRDVLYFCMFCEKPMDSVASSE